MTPTTNHGSATVRLSEDANDAALTDADTSTAGHQVDLNEERNVIVVKVTAEDGTSTQSYTVTVTRAGAPPGKVTEVTVTPGDGALVVGWAAVSDATGYRVQWKSGTQGYNTTTRQAVIDSGSTVSHTIASLTNGTEYTVRVTATRTGADDGPHSDEVTGTPLAADTTAPAFSSATVDGATLVLTFDEPLAAASDLANAAFTVKKTPSGGVAETVALSGSPSMSGATVTLTLAAAVVSTDTVTVSYTVPSTDSNNRLEDAAGNEVAAFTDEAVTNNTAVANTAATGRPEITGTPQVGRTLTAGQGDIADANGLPATFTYQWVRVGTGGTETDVGTSSTSTSSTYTPVAADVGSTLKVRVTFTDDAEFEETLSSEVTATVVAAAQGCPARTHADWCTLLTVGTKVRTASTAYGYSAAGSDPFGSLADPGITHGTVLSYEVDTLMVVDPDSGADTVVVGFDGARAVHGTVFDFGGTQFTATAADEHSTDDTRYRWDAPAGFAVWLDGQEVTVSANLPPVLQSAAVDGASLVLTHAEALDTGSVPAASTYTVTVGGTGAATVERVGLGQGGDADAGDGGGVHRHGDGELRGAGIEPGARRIGARRPGVHRRGGDEQHRRLHRRDAERPCAHPRRRHRGRTELGIRFGYVHLHGVGRERGHAGHGDADHEPWERHRRLRGQRRHRAHRRGREHHRPRPGPGGG